MSSQGRLRRLKALYKLKAHYKAQTSGQEIHHRDVSLPLLWVRPGEAPVLWCILAGGHNSLFPSGTAQLQSSRTRGRIHLTLGLAFLLKSQLPTHNSHCINSHCTNAQVNVYYLPPSENISFNHVTLYSLWTQSVSVLSCLIYMA